jgi:hypothetical protein
VVSGYGLKDPTGKRTLRLVVNDQDLGAVPLPTQIADLSFPVPAGILMNGDNSVVLATERLVRPADILDSDDTRQLGILVESVQFHPQAAAGSDAVCSPAELWEERSTLDSSRIIRLPLARLAGAELDLAWRTQPAARKDALNITVSDAWEADLLFSEQIALGQSRGSAHLIFPRDLPDQIVLTLALAGPDEQPATTQLVLETAILKWDYQPHNVVLIIVDTLRPDYLGCYRDQDDLTPQIDRLAADGILFTQAWAHSPITGPSHAALFTSRYPLATGVLNNSSANLPHELPLLAEILQVHGYATGAAISLPPLRHALGFDRGFTLYDDRFGVSLMVTADTLLTRALNILAELSEPFFLWAHFCDPHEPYNAHGLIERTATLTVDREVIAQLPASTHTVETFDLTLPAGEATIRVRADHPFMMRKIALQRLQGIRPKFVHEDPLWEPTTDYKAIIGAQGARQVRLIIGISDQIRDKQELRERYSREVTFVDHHVGALLDTLRSRDLYDESMIVFISDHGEALGEHGHIGHIHTLYDPMVRIPMIIKPPLGTGSAPGQRREDPVALIDVTPTILAQLGLAAPTGARGRNLLPAQAGDTPPLVLCETHVPQADQDLYGLWDSRYKIILAPAEGLHEVYDRQEDPAEQHDLFSPDDSLAQAWQHRLQEALTELQRQERHTDEVTIDPETERQLKALGY